MDKLEALLDKYEQKFDDCFPLMLCRCMNEDEICDIVQECLDKNAPYAPELDRNADY